MSNHEEVLFTQDVGGQFKVVGKLVHDPDPECPVKLNDEKSNHDYNGAIYRFERHNDFQNQSYFDSYENDPFAFKLAKYEHGDVVWSLSGEGPQCQFDTTRHAGYWVCEGGARENYDTILAEKGETAAKQWLIDRARAVLEEFTNWCNGWCWGVVVEVTPLGEDPDEAHSCWGYYGVKDAKEELQHRFDAEVKECQAVVDERISRARYHATLCGFAPELVGVANLGYRYLGVRTDRNGRFVFAATPTAEAIVAGANKAGDTLHHIWDLDGKETAHGSRVLFTTGFVLGGAA